MKRNKTSYFAPSLLVFLVISALLWYGDKLSENYSTRATIPVKIQNDFSANMWIEEPQILVNCQVEGAGTTLLSYKIKFGDKLTIPMSQLDLISIPGEERKFRIDRSSLRSALSAAAKEIRITQVLDSANYIHVSPVEVRKMPIQSQIEVYPAKQYMQVGKITFSPDSVEVRGPKVILDSIQGIRTKEKSYTDTKSSISGTIALEPVNGVMASHSETEFNIRISSYTQSTLELPVRIINLPDTLQGITVPAQVKVTVNVPLNDYDRLREDGLSAYIDYRQIRGGHAGKQYVIQVDSLPGGTEVVRINPQLAEPFFSKK